MSTYSIGHERYDYESFGAYVMRKNGSHWDAECAAR